MNWAWWVALALICAPGVLFMWCVIAASLRMSGIIANEDRSRKWE